ncbi:MAG: cyclic nucleotide-binding domain-containing protein, partial [Chloroflexi bacterium]|nr:cyclic nucleotide-binding domain-containing protein [Chloroflexota bacterium]
LKIIGLLSNPRAMDLVRKSMEGGDAEARASALEALETLGDKTLARGIVSLLEEEPEHSTISSVIEHVLNSRDRWMRALAVRALQELGLKEFNSRLAALGSDPDALIRESAVETLVQFGEVSPMETLQTVSMLERVLLLREVPIFADLSPEDLEQIARIAREQWYPNATALFHEGEEASMMFIIVDGQVRVLRAADGKEQVLAQRGPGDFVGEMAIIESAPRSATLITQGDVRLLAIEGETFKEILRERPEVSLAVLKSLSRRLREMVNERRS